MVEGLVLETFSADGTGVQLRARRACLNDFPGWGEGSLEGVEIRVGNEIRAVAPRGQINGDGSLRLTGAEVTSSRQKLRILAAEAYLSPTGDLRATKVRARLGSR